MGYTGGQEAAYGPSFMRVFNEHFYVSELLSKYGCKLKSKNINYVYRKELLFSAPLQ
jgi:hypothetical protein